MDAAVIGGKDRWERRLNGLEAEFVSTREAARISLQNLKQFALPLIGMLDALPAAAIWSVWLEHLADWRAWRCATRIRCWRSWRSWRRWATSDPLALEEVAEVLSERLRFLRAEPPPSAGAACSSDRSRKRAGASSASCSCRDSPRVCSRRGLLEDPLLLDELREASAEHLPLRERSRP